jgi:hypothetical protein
MSSTIKTSAWKVLMSYIALVPTKNNPILVNDFRHISLLNSLTRILVDRLQAVKLKLIHHNQYIFLRGQTIKVSAFRDQGVPGPTSEMSPRAPAQMGRREAERKGGREVAGDRRERGGNPAAFVFVPQPGRVRLQ